MSESDPAGQIGDNICFDVSELAELAGVQTSTLRYYEREGLLQPAGRSSGRRFYNQHGLRQLAAIAWWQEAGFTLNEMAMLFDETGGSAAYAKSVASERIVELQKRIEHLTHVKDVLAHVMGCVHDRLDDCPEYQEHVRTRASEIASGRHRDRHHCTQTIHRVGR
ncbi:MAG: MerR family transcriptional regulator [Pseudonocardiaceae bacterium]|nr:MerR family transcriptional regulator [Pseudonocardiaceae bacterium]